MQKDTGKVEAKKKIMRDAMPGDVFQIAVLGVNGPLGNPPGNKIFLHGFTGLEFFDPDALVFNWSNEWPCPWRPALENADDAHFRYLHRNSVRLLMQPIAPPAFPPKGRPTRIGKYATFEKNRGRFEAALISFLELP